MQNPALQAQDGKDFRNCDGKGHKLAMPAIAQLFRSADGNADAAIRRDGGKKLVQIQRGGIGDYGLILHVVFHRIQSVGAQHAHRH